MSQEENKTNPSKQNQALIRYVAILFGVAFIMVLVSFLMSVHGNREDLSQITQSANSALVRAEELQNANRLLTEENQTLKQQIQAIASNTADGEKQVVEAYELLTRALAAREAGNQQELLELLEELETKHLLLSDAGQELYQGLLDQAE